MLIIS